MNKQYFVTGIGTSVGKTVAAAALVKLWSASYWKPIQSGDLETSDSMMVSELLSGRVNIYPEQYKLNTPASPHYSAEIDGIAINLGDFQIPQIQGNLIVEGAGGLFVPINEQEFIIDLIVHLNLPVVLVCSDYLGSINHSILSFQSLTARGIPVDYVLLNGNFRESSRRILVRHRPVGSKIITLPELEGLDSQGLDKAMMKMTIEE